MVNFNLNTGALKSTLDMFCDCPKCVQVGAFELSFLRNFFINSVVFAGIMIFATLFSIRYAREQWFRKLLKRLPHTWRAVLLGPLMKKGTLCIGYFDDAGIDAFYTHVVDNSIESIFDKDDEAKPTGVFAMSGGELQKLTTAADGQRGLIQVVPPTLVCSEPVDSVCNLSTVGVVERSCYTTTHSCIDECEGSEFSEMVSEEMTFRCFLNGKGYALTVLVNEPYHWIVDDNAEKLVRDSIGDTHGCLVLDLEHKCDIFRMWAEQYGVGGTILINNGAVYSGPVVWRTIYAKTIPLRHGIQTLVDLDQMGDMVHSDDTAMLGFAGEAFNFKITKISILQTKRSCRSATDVEIISMIVRVGELGRLDGRRLTVVSRDKIYANLVEIAQAYGAIMSVRN